ncbi:MAG: hypothetical protein RLZZ70_427 [Candidatus Parcubacteria bacterium]|jgi:hypothetical protein
MLVTFMNERRNLSQKIDICEKISRLMLHLERRRSMTTLAVITLTQPLFEGQNTPQVVYQGKIEVAFDPRPGMRICISDHFAGQMAYKGAMICITIIEEPLARVQKTGASKQHYWALSATLPALTEIDLGGEKMAEKSVALQSLMVAHGWVNVTARAIAAESRANHRLESA